MDWINSLFTTHSSIQTVVVLSMIIACGLALGKLKVMGVSLNILRWYLRRTPWVQYRSRGT